MTIYQDLSKPFDRIFKKPVTGLNYITGEQVTSRLNEVLGWDKWSFRVLEHGFNEDIDELWCLGELTVITEAAAVVKQQFGSQKPNRYAKNNQIIDLGFDLKGAATDALKKCASLIGVGLYLHEKDAPAQQAVGATRPKPSPSDRAAHSPPTAAPKKPGFLELTAQMGFSVDEVEVASQRLFDNRSLKQLGIEQKKRLLVELEDMKRKKASAA